MQITPGTPGSWLLSANLLLSRKQACRELSIQTCEQKDGVRGHGSQYTAIISVLAFALARHLLLLLFLRPCVPAAAAPLVVPRCEVATCAHGPRLVVIVVAGGWWLACGA